MDKFFEKYSNEKGITYANVIPDTSFLDAREKHETFYLRKIKAIKVLTAKAKGDKGESLARRLYKDALRSLPLEDFQKTLEVKDDEKRVQIYSKSVSDAENLGETLIIVKNGDETTVVWIRGKVDMSLLKHLPKAFKGYGF